MGTGRVDAVGVIAEAARGRLFRERDVRQKHVWHEAMAMAQFLGLVTPHGHGVWSHPHYTPSRYELLQIRFPKAVFWGPSALWLLGAEPVEPEALWIAIGNKSRPPRTLDLSTVIVRTRKLEKDVLGAAARGTSDHAACSRRGAGAPRRLAHGRPSPAARTRSRSRAIRAAPEGELSVGRIAACPLASPRGLGRRADASSNAVKDGP